MKEELFDDLCDRYYKDVYKYAVFCVNDTQMAQDIVQDTFIIVYKNINKLYNHVNAGGYIYKTAQNIIKNYKKRLYKMIIKEMAIDDNVRNIEDYNSSIEYQSQNSIDEYEYITDVIDGLSDYNKKLYNMYYVENKSMKNIAQILDIEYTALRMKYVRLRKEIKEIVKKISDNFIT